MLVVCVEPSQSCEWRRTVSVRYRKQFIKLRQLDTEERAWRAQANDGCRMEKWWSEGLIAT